MEKAVKEAGEAVPLGPFKTKAMDPHYRGENLPGNTVWDDGKVVTYLDEAERQSKKLQFKDGKIYDANGSLFDTTYAKRDKWVTGEAIYVMDKNGNFYVSNLQKVGEFHHSSFLAGQPVAAAGQIEVKNGVLKLISDVSGHYKPGLEFSEQAVQALRQLGIDVPEEIIHFWAK